MTEMEKELVEENKQEMKRTLKHCPHAITDLADGTDMARLMSTYVNGHSDAQRFAKGIVNEHRTLQQSSMRFFMACIKEWSKCNEPGYFDPRNEATVKLSCAIVKLLEENPDLDCFPSI